MARLSLIIIFLIYLISFTSRAEIPLYGSNVQIHMKKAIPIWAEGREKEMNLTLGFIGKFHQKKTKNLLLKLQHPLSTEYT